MDVEEEEEEEEDDDVEGEDVEEENRSQDQETHCVRACAVETHMDISQNPFCVVITWEKMGKMPHALATTSIKHRALTLTVRTLQCGHTVWGKKTIQQSMFRNLIGTWIPR